MNRLELERAVSDAALEGAPMSPERVRLLSRLLGMDERLLLHFKRYHGPWRTRAARVLTTLGDAKSWTVMGLALLAAGRPRTTHAALRLAAGSTFGALAAQALKRTLRRARPTSAIAGFEALADNPDAWSFPSGHTSAAFGAAVALSGEVACLGPLSLLLATGIALSRVYLGAHYPIDVLLGGVLGAGSGLAARVAIR